MTEIDETAEEPLDPATERVRRKMVRLLAVSIGIMLIGVMAVLAAVVYRTSEGGGRLEAGASVPLALPVAGDVVQSSLDGDRLLLQLRPAGGTDELLVFDRRDGTLLSRHPLVLP
ncbi:fimbrial protein [Aureimonas populi]|uniref:Fimbrial protein n=1 Tax=Aureimonas populi TaxID=1701758 RepID=A0ABW5CJF9_9HYPH|nr:fimbrial protein [Aureimonas populi]